MVSLLRLFYLILFFSVSFSTYLSAAPFSFQVNNKNFSIDIPDTYCQPEKGSDLALYWDSISQAMLASNISKNIIHLYECEPDGPYFGSTIWLRKFDKKLPNTLSASEIRAMLTEALKKSANEILSAEKVTEALSQIKSQTGEDIELTNVILIQDTEFLTTGTIKVTELDSEIFKEYVLCSYIFFRGQMMFLYLSFSLDQLEDRFKTSLNSLTQISRSVQLN